MPQTQIQGGDTRISQLPNAASLNSADLFVIVQAGQTKNLTAQQVANLILSVGPVTITGGTLNNVTIGNTTPGPGSFTSLSATSGTLNNMTIGNVTPGSGAFTTVSTNNISSGTFAGYSYVGNWASTVAATNASIALASARGTLAAPTATQTNDVFGNIDAFGYTGSGYGYSASIDFQAAGIFSPTSFPSQIVFNTTPVGTIVPVAVGSFGSNGNFNSLNNVTVTLGGVFQGAYSTAFTDGTVVDYTAGNGRISVGTTDTLTLYTGGIGTTQMAQFSATTLTAPTVTVTAAATANTAAIGYSATNGFMLAPKTGSSNDFILLNASGSTGVALIPTGQSNLVFRGTATNDNAPAAVVGEFITSTQGASLSISTTTPTNATSISLSPGDWDVSGVLTYSAAATTTVNWAAGAINTTTANIGTLGVNYNLFYYGTITPTASFAFTVPAPIVRISVATTTTVYLVGYIGFGTSTMSFGGTINARRVR